MSWLPTALAIQAIVLFFAPPIALAGRKVFVSDLWLWAWLVPALFHLRGRLRWFFGATALVVGAIYLRGLFRPSLFAQLAEVGFFMSRQDDDFQRGRELVVAVRFLSWLWAGAISGWWFSQRKSAEAVGKLVRVLAACLLAAGAAMVLAKLSAPVRAALGGIYQYNPDYDHWQGRMYGVFLSPVEAGATLGLGVVVLVAAMARGLLQVGTLSIGAVAFAIAGILLSQTATVAFALAACALAPAFGRALRRQRRAAIAAIAVAAVLCAMATMTSDTFNHFLGTKLENITFRLRAWSVYGKLLSSRADHALFGFGFAGYHADSSYLYLLIRGGLVTLGLAIAGIGYVLARNWLRWDWAQRFIPIYLLALGLTLDALIFRHVIGLMIAVGIPLLTLSRRRG